MDMSFYFAAPIRRFAVLFLTSNMLVKTHSDSLALVFLTSIYVIGILELLSVTHSGVNAIAASRTSLCFFGRHTYLHVDIYILCCSYICV